MPCEAPVLIIWFQVGNWIAASQLTSYAKAMSSLDQSNNAQSRQPRFLEQEQAPRSRSQAQKVPGPATV